MDSRESAAKKIILEAVSKVPGGARPLEVLDTAEQNGVTRRIARDALQHMISAGELTVGWDRRLHVKQSPLTTQAS